MCAVISHAKPLKYWPDRSQPSLAHTRSCKQGESADADLVLGHDVIQPSNLKTVRIGGKLKFPNPAVNAWKERAALGKSVTIIGIHLSH